jgi:hypothetical protein
MQRPGFSARQFIIWAFTGIVAFSAIVTVAALLTVVNWGGADEQVRQMLPPPQGQTTSEVGEQAP